MENIYSELKYRWYVISLAAVSVSLCVAMPNICMTVLFREISTDLGLSLVQIGWIWGFYPMTSLFTVLIAGLLADRFGPKRMLVFACSLTGLAGASRGLAANFSGLAFSSILSGFITGIIPANIFKVATTWFPPHQLGFATGILATGMGVGFTIGSMISATLLSPLLGSWRGVLFLYGSISLFIALLWLITYKESQWVESKDSSDRASIRETMCHLLYNKNALLIGFASLGLTACIQGMIGYLPFYLREYKAWSPASADGTLAVFTGFSTLAALPICMLSDKIGSRKLLIIPIITISFIGVGLLSVADGLIIWLIILMVGIGRDGSVALASASIVESEGIGAKYSGTASGFLQTLSRIGYFLSPPIGNSMAVYGDGIPFIVWAIFGAFALVCFLLSKEIGLRRR